MREKKQICCAENVPKMYRYSTLEEVEHNFSLFLYGLLIVTHFKRVQYGNGEEGE